MYEFWIFFRMLLRVEFLNFFFYMEKIVYGGYKVKLILFMNMYIFILYKEKSLKI